MRVASIRYAGSYGRSYAARTKKSPELDPGCRPVAASETRRAPLLPVQNGTIAIRASWRHDGEHHDDRRKTTARDEPRPLVLAP